MRCISHLLWKFPIRSLTLNILPFVIMANFTTGSRLVRSGSFATRQNLYRPIPEGTCVFARRSVHAQNLFFAGFFRVAEARVCRWFLPCPLFYSTFLPRANSHTLFNARYLTCTNSCVPVHVVHTLMEVEQITLRFSTIVFIWQTQYSPVASLPSLGSYITYTTRAMTKKRKDHRNSSQDSVHVGTKITKLAIVTSKRLHRTSHSSEPLPELP